ncbi:MAG: hypothetical protein Q8K43_11945 [Sulfurimicrobium sp.]|nr:hypothetical protein [Sulfurimicrobium sp.]MDO9188364.1 hypothetical protein [Sulfurimicrobium sp.]MDP1705940.1 hypothetical protein [Sulfurimicrobium sp.]MDP1898586.1 hypothetical protein [Sulfurimicrobium sp.]MDP2197626.1 hypothetical protein [Sulfurimicrobium sp.]
MNHISTNHKRQGQRGVVLFIALIALVVMSLAAVALVRSVDTSTLVAGNLAFKQAATSSADAALESAIPWMKTVQAAQTTDPRLDITHAFNVDSPTSGYYASMLKADSSEKINLADASIWTAAASRPGTGTNFNADGLDSTTGNTVRYIIQRVCRSDNATQLLSSDMCLFSDFQEDNGSKRGRLTYDAGLGIGASSGGSPLYRITARVTGPRNTVSYIQAYSY